MTNAAARRSYFLPYQEAWLRDKSRLKISEKSRRIGMTYVQSYEDVVDAARKKDPVDVWFSSADESAAREYIRYATQWAELLNLAAEQLGEIVIDKDDDIKASVIEFANGKRVYGLSSNPKSFRSKGGKLVIDEFGFHEDQEGLWKAAYPLVTWGYPARILSTYNGKGNRYYRMVQDAHKGNAWSLHTTTIEDAVAQGLADKIIGRKLTDEERGAWLEELREGAGDEDTWQQEYMCNPVDEATAFLTYELIATCESGAATLDLELDDLDPRGDYYLGMDIGRKKDLTVIWLLEKVGDVYWTRKVVQLSRVAFWMQEEVLYRILPIVRRACIDATGIGMQLAENAKRRFGSYKVEEVTFTNAVKSDLAVTLRRSFEDKGIRIPINTKLRENLHKVRKEVTTAGNIRFDAESTEDGHADEFWAVALARHAGGTAKGPIEAKRVSPGRSSDFKGRGW